MHLVRVGPALIGFSERGDGDLGFYNWQEEHARQVWSDLPVVREEGLDWPRHGIQVHGDHLHEVTAASAAWNQGPGDALVTRDADLPLGVFTADCLPVMLVGDGIIAAVHAGWKSTRLDLAGKVVARLADRYGVVPSSLTVVMGPCIGSCCLELGDEVPPTFAEADPAFLGCFSRGRKWHLDLRALNVLQCVRRGVRAEAIQHLNDCTLCHPDRFFSYRHERPRKGSMFSFIVRQAA